MGYGYFVVWEGMLLPFLGTSLGAGCVFFGRRFCRQEKETLLNGFAAGVMMAASVWSLLLPALEDAAAWGRLSFLPVSVGCFLGLLFLRVTESFCSRFESDSFHNTSRTNKTLFFAITLHNLPEGMAVGIVWAGYLSGLYGVGLTGAMALSVGIAVQNIPEGAIVSLPLHRDGIGKGKSFLWGVASGAVEPVSAILTLLAAEAVLPLMPWLLGFAAGAMLYAVVSELLPSVTEVNRKNVGIVGFFIGFLLMMALDNAF